MGKKFVLRVGDIFTIPIDENRVGVGAIAHLGKEKLMIAVFNFIINEKETFDLDNLKNLPIILFGYTLDAKLYHKHWPIIGNIKLEDMGVIYFPYFKIGTPPDKIYIVNYKGDKLRGSTRDEFDELDYEKTVAPIRYENALKSYFGLGEWKDDYNCLLYSNVLNSVKLIENRSSINSFRSI